MYISDHMTEHPFTISPETSVSKALDIMGIHHFHRLPVVDPEGKLVGLLTEGLISEASGRDITSLSIYELNYLLSRTKASEIMIRDVVTVQPDMFLEEGAKLMADHEVGVLPVVDPEDHVLGIITDKDVFTAFTEIMGYQSQGTRFVISLKDVPGEFAKICELFAGENANLENIAVYHTKERGVEVVVKATGEVSVERMSDVIRENGFVLNNVVQTEKSGNRILWVSQGKQVR